MANKCLTPEEFETAIDESLKRAFRYSVSSTERDRLFAAKDTVNWFAGKTLHKAGLEVTVFVDGWPLP